jgi:chemotaxis protein CheX
MKSPAEVDTDKWLPLLRHSTHEIFEIMLGAKLEPGRPEPLAGVEFTAMVGLAGCVCGVLRLQCNHQGAMHVACKMLDLPPHRAAEHAWDALGEVANMIAGNFKNKIGGLSDKCLLSVPTVITGADYSFHSLADSGPLDLWFRFHDSPLRVTLEIHR